jgi:predicted Zn-dependent peptidase
MQLILENLDHPLSAYLSNGIRFVHQPMKRAIGHCGLMIGCGSRDEFPLEHGLAHYIEHGLFKGTKKRNNTQVLSRLDAVGGEINAFTAKEETWIHASFLNEHTERAIELIADIALNSVFDDEEMAKEKDVIIDEINGYKDSPTDMLFEELDDMVFPNHPIGRSILGTEESVKGFKQKDVVSFYKRCFVNQNMVFSYAGPIAFEKMFHWLEKYFERVPSQTAQFNRPDYPAYGKLHLKVNKEIHQAHYGMACRAPHLHDKERHAFILLNNLLGGPAMNNILNLKIREKHGIAYQVDSNYSPFTDTGVFSIYLGTEVHQLEKALTLIEKELELLRDKPFAPKTLNGYKTQLKGQLALAQDSGSSLMFNNGKSLWVYNRIHTMQEVFDVVDQITPEDIQAVAQKYLDPKKFTSLTYLPVH